MIQRISNAVKTTVEKTAKTIRANASTLAKTAALVGTFSTAIGAGVKGLSHPSLNRKNLQPMHVLSVRK